MASTSATSPAPSPACSSRSATTRATSWSRASSTSTRGLRRCVEGTHRSTATRSRRLRLRRPRRPHLPAGHHRCRLRLRRGPGRRALPRRPRGPRARRSPPRRRQDEADDRARRPHLDPTPVATATAPASATQPTRSTTERSPHGSHQGHHGRHLRDDVLKNDKPVIVDFWAPWCGPCRAVAPILEEIAAAYGDKIEVVKLNTDENPAVTSRYGIISIPTINVYVNGEVVKTLVGAMPKPQAAARARGLHRQLTVMPSGRVTARRRVLRVP